MTTQLPQFLQGIRPMSYQNETEVFAPKPSKTEVKIKEISTQRQPQVESEKYTPDMFFQDIKKVKQKESIDTDGAAKAVLSAYKQRGIEVEGIDIDVELASIQPQEVVEDGNKKMTERIGESFEKRTEQRQEIEESDRNFFRKKLDQLAVGAGTFSDLVGAGVGEAFETSGQIISAITPDSFEEKVKDNVISAVTAVAESQPGQDLGQFLGQTGKGAKAVFDVLPEDIQKDVESLGTVGLGILDAVGAGVAVKQAPKVAGVVKDTVGKKTFLTEGKRNAFIEKQSIDIDKTLGQIAQPGKKDLGNMESFKSSIKNIDTSDVDTYKDLFDRFDDKISVIARKQDEILPSDKAFTIEDLTQSSKKGTIQVNHVEQALDDMETLYDRIGDIDNLERIRELRAGNLSVKDINSIAREYNTQFGQKAFTITGEQKFSDIGRSFENTRKGVKETSRGLLPDDTMKILDSEMSDLFKAKEISKKMVDKVEILRNKIDERGLLAGLSNKAGRVLDFMTGGIPKEFVSSALLKSGMGKSVLDSFTLQERLAKNIKLFEKAMSKIEKAEDARVVSKILEELGATLGISREAINAQADRAKDAIGGLADDVVDKITTE